MTPTLEELQAAYSYLRGLTLERKERLRGVELSRRGEHAGATLRCADPGRLTLSIEKDLRRAIAIATDEDHELAMADWGVDPRSAQRSGEQVERHQAEVALELVAAIKVALGE